MQTFDAWLHILVYQYNPSNTDFEYELGNVLLAFTDMLWLACEEEATHDCKKNILQTSSPYSNISLASFLHHWQRTPININEFTQSSSSGSPWQTMISRGSIRLESRWSDKKG